MDLKLLWQMFAKQFFEYKGYEMVLQGLLNTVIIAVLGLFIGIIIGVIIAVVKIMPSKSIGVKISSKICDIYVAIFRGTPIVVQLLIMYFVLKPLVGLNGLPALFFAIIAFGLNSGAYLSENIRAGIQSIDKGQMEAGRSLGLNYSKTMILIILPQAIKNILPTIGNEFISLIKETSVVGMITVRDLTTAFKGIGSANYQYLIPYLMLAAVYFVLVYIISYLVKLLERRLKRSDRG